MMSATATVMSAITATMIVNTRIVEVTLQGRAALPDCGKAIEILEVPLRTSRNSLAGVSHVSLKTSEDSPSVDHRHYLPGSPSDHPCPYSPGRQC
eukprot:scaffold294076_cov22-Prasinocladus_malaysianus.AAC.2